MSIKTERSRNITNVSATDHKVRLQMATSVCASDFKFIKCRLKLKAQEILQTPQLVKLTVNQRVQGMTSEQVQFRDLLLRLRKGESTVDDWNLLLTRQPSNITNLCDFEDATRLFYSNEQVALQQSAASKA